MAGKYYYNGSTGNLDIDGQKKKDKVTWGDQMLSGQRSVFPEQTSKQLAARLPNKDTYVHEQVTFDSALGRFVGGVSDKTYEMKEAVNQNANFDQIEYLEALGKGEAWAFDRNDKLMKIAQQDQAERFNDKILKRDKYKNAPNEILKDSVKRKESARAVLDSLKKDEEAVKEKPVVVTRVEIEKPLNKIIQEKADEKLKSEQNAWDRRYGLGGIPTIKRPD